MYLYPYPHKIADIEGLVRKDCSRFTHPSGRRTVMWWVCRERKEPRRFDWTKSGRIRMRGKLCGAGFIFRRNSTSDCSPFFKKAIERICIWIRNEGIWPQNHR